MLLRTVFPWSLALLAAALLAGCQPADTTPVAGTAASAAAMPGLYGSDIRAETNLGGDFTLTGQDGRPVSLSAFKGKVVALMFGYTNCPDVCPTNLFTAAEAVKQLGEAGNDVQVLLVSVDPERDTPAVLAQYVPVFNPSFIGLTVDPADQSALNQVKRQYRVVSQKMPRDDGRYLVDHSAGMYLIDRNGQAAVYEPHGQTATQLAHDLKILLE